VRCALSVAGGAGLGVLLPASPVWMLWLVLLLCLRIHWLCAIAGWLLGAMVYHLTHSGCARLGAAILNAQPDWWREVLSAPVMCYSMLHNSADMGHAALALIAVTVVLLVLLPIVAIHRVRTRAHHSPT
jgi:hypothetical protein